MSQFQSVFLPNMKDNEDETEVRKMGQDILVKLNQLGDATVTMLSDVLDTGISMNKSFIISKTSGSYTIYIPDNLLIAQTGGPYNLTITTGVSGSDVIIIPISPSGCSINSGNLLFDIYVDSSGNVISKGWNISGSNSNGNYEYSYDGELRQYFPNVTITGGTNYTWTLPVPFINTNYSSPGGQSRSNTLQVSLQENRPTLFTRTTSQIQFNPVILAGAGTGLVDLQAIGRWR